MSAVLTEFTTRETIEFRKPVLTRIDVSWEDAGGTWRTTTARMEDRSSGGACIRVKAPIPPGSKVRIQSRQDDFAGETRHCRAEGADFLIGIQRDVAEAPHSNRSISHVPPQKNVGTGRQAVSTVLGSRQTPPERQENEPSEVPAVDQKKKDDSTPVEGLALAPAPPVHGVDHEMDTRNISPSRPPTIDPILLAGVQAEIRAEFRAELRTEVLAAVREAVRAELQTELKTKQPPTQAGKEEKHMRSKWLELPWRKNPEDPNISGPEDAEASDGNSNSNREKENCMSDLSQPMPKPPVRSAREVPTFQVDLSPMEDIYRAIGIMNPPRGYSITKVVEMLNSEHIRDLSKDMKRAAVLMALDAAGTSLEQLQKDAKARQDALDAHEAQQRKQVEAEWARKAEEIVQIQAEMDSIKAHYTGRISRNLDGVARQKATFAEWVNSKQQECRGMAEAIELCSKSPLSASASPSSPSSEVGPMKANAKTV
jgi:lambda repressor-like predicted transcriptional regulator